MKVEDRSAWCVILKAELVKQYGPCAAAAADDDDEEEEIVSRLSEKMFPIVRGKRRLKHLQQ